MARRAKGGIEATGETVTFEVHEMNLSSKDQETFERDHPTFLSRYLAENGFEAREVACTHRGQVGPEARPKLYHELLPRRSRYI
jgi:hypothetical protein